MVQWLKLLANKPDYLSSIPGTQGGRPDSYTLFSDLINVMVCNHVHTCMYIHKETLKWNKRINSK